MPSRFLQWSRFLAPGQPDWAAKATTRCIGGTLLGMGLGALGLGRRTEPASAVVAVASVLGFSLALVSLGSLFAVVAVKKVRAGRSENYSPETGLDMEPVTRSGAPGAFWFDVVMSGLLAAAFYLAALALIVAAAAGTA